ncbi:MAG TPA: helix-turn-helix domain-containing protein [Patescibacteria group bacterium]|nr:helix-turn-helix domain-containing protein [Patescibacteria group bacterium]
MNQSSAATVTLDDVMRLVLPLTTIVIGGDYSGRQANWVSILTELDNLEGQILAGDIVFLPDALQQSASDVTLAEMIQSLAWLSASALLTFRPISKNVIQAAEFNDLPVMIVSGDVTLRELHQRVAGLLVDRQKQIAERGLQLYRRLTEMSREGQGLAAMTEVMSRLTGKMVAVQDKRLEIVAITIPPGLGIELEAAHLALGRQDTLPRPLHNRKEAATSSQSHWQQLLPIGDQEMARLISPIVSGDRARGYVSVVGQPDELDLLDMVTADYGAAACALEMAKEKAISEVKKELRGNFLEGLLAGKILDEEIERLAGRLDHDTNCPHVILTFRWEGNDVPSLRRMESPLHNILSSHNRPALTHIYSTDHVCIFQALEEGDDDINTGLELARRLREHLRSEFPQKRLVGGISGPAATLAEWPIVYRQAVQAMRLAERLHLDTIVEFNSLDIYQLLAELEDFPATHRFCEKIIGPLVHYDERHRSSLVKTIDAYFDYRGNISQTSERLFVHRNTLLYRLERIQEVTGQNLENPDERLALHLALKFWQLRPEADGKVSQ